MARSWGQLEGMAQRWEPWPIDSKSGCIYFALPVPSAGKDKNKVPTPYTICSVIKRRGWCYSKSFHRSPCCILISPPPSPGQTILNFCDKHGYNFSILRKNTDLGQIMKFWMTGMGWAGKKHEELNLVRIRMELQ